MKIETFQKIQKKLFDLALLPLSLFAVICIYFWQSVWQNHFAITTLAFAASIVLCLYYLLVNILYRPLSFLIQIYRDNKKYKTMRKITLKQTQSVKKQENRALTPIQNQDELEFITQKSGKGQKSALGKHIAFKLDQKEVPQRQFKFNSNVKIEKQKQPSRIVNVVSKNNLTQNAVDIDDIFTYSSVPNKPTKQRMKEETQTDQIQENQYFFQRTQKLQRHLQGILQYNQQQNLKRPEYEQRYNKYKQTLRQFSFDKQIVEKLLFETKLTIKEKIEQNVKKQFENLDKIQSLVRKNFDVNFKSYKERASDLQAKNIYASRTANSNSYSQIVNQNQQGFGFNKKQGVSFQSLSKEINFEQMLQQSSNLIHCHYFDFEYVGEPGRHNQIKGDLKILLKIRLDLDKYLNLKRPIVQTKEQLQMNKQPCQQLNQFEERYLHILKLQNLAFILGQRQSAQENLLKQFFSRSHLSHSHVDRHIEEINDQKNYQLLMMFMVKTFQQKIQLANSSETLKVQLSKPSFEDKNASFIWIRKERSSKSHYNIVYSLRKDQNKNQTAQQRQKTNSDRQKSKQQNVHICPGQSNIWICILFVRLLVSKIGLKKEQYSMIKDKRLRKDFERVVELLK